MYHKQIRYFLIRSTPLSSGSSYHRSERLADMEENIFGQFGDPQKLYFGGDMNAAIALSGQVAEELTPLDQL